MSSFHPGHLEAPPRRRGEGGSARSGGAHEDVEPDSRDEVERAPEPVEEPGEAGPGTVTRLLGAVREGREGAFRDLFSRVYRELRLLAHRQRRRAGWDPTLNTTALVHEAYLKLAGAEGLDLRDRAHFRAVAARAIRQILIDDARRRSAAKRGGRDRPLPLERVRGVLRDPATASLGERTEAVLALEAALERLEERAERQCRIVECRFFGGMTVEETAAALGVSAPTVKRGWSMARAWLYRELGGAAG